MHVCFVSDYAHMDWDIKYLLILKYGTEKYGWNMHWVERRVAEDDCERTLKYQRKMETVPNKWWKYNYDSKEVQTTYLNMFA